MSSDHHVITISTEPCRCGTSGHRDGIATCSCGWQAKQSHVSYAPDFSQEIMGHRVSILEEKLGISIHVGYVT